MMLRSMACDIFEFEVLHSDGLIRKCSRATVRLRGIL